MIRVVGHSVTKLIMDTWKAQATSQRQNLENDRDIKLFTRALPFLKNVHSIYLPRAFTMQLGNHLASEPTGSSLLLK